MRANLSNTTTNQTPPTDDTGNGPRGLFATAVDLARRGRYAEAAVILQKALNAGECPPVEALDLQARIYAQQGFYLHAESCWRKAQSLDHSNPVYGNAIDRLRQANKPTGRAYRIFSLLCGVAFFVLVVWQIAFVNPEFRRRQAATDRSLSEIPGDLGAFGNASKSRDNELFATLFNIKGNLLELDTRLSTRLEAVPTTSKETAQHKAIEIEVSRLGQMINERLGVLDTKVTSLMAEEAKARKADAARLLDQFGAVNTAVLKRNQSLQSATTKAAADIVELSELTKKLHMSTNMQIADLKITGRKGKEEMIDMIGSLTHKITDIERTISTRIDAEANRASERLAQLRSLVETISAQNQKPNTSVK